MAAAEKRGVHQSAAQLSETRRAQAIERYFPAFLE